MTKPDNIPQDIWDAANDMSSEWLMPGGEDHTMATNDIARAILAERDRLTSPEFLEIALVAAMKEAGVKVITTR